VNRADVADHAHLGQGDIAQEGDLARHVETHFQHGALVTGAQPQDGERQADLVVQVAGAFQRAIALIEHLRDHFLGGGFADAAGDADDAQIQLAAPEARDLLQRGDGILDPQAQRRAELFCAEPRQVLQPAQVHAAVRIAGLTLDQGEGGAAAEGVVDEVVAVGVFARHGDEQRAGNGLARIDRRLGDHRSGFGAQARQGFEGVGKRQHCSSMIGAQAYCRQATIRIAFVAQIVFILSRNDLVADRIRRDVEQHHRPLGHLGEDGRGGLRTPDRGGGPLEPDINKELRVVHRAPTDE
jgi:hypothetical protein